MKWIRIIRSYFDFLCVDFAVVQVRAVAGRVSSRRRHGGVRRKILVRILRPAVSRGCRVRSAALIFLRTYYFYIYIGQQGPYT